MKLLAKIIFCTAAFSSTAFADDSFTPAEVKLNAQIQAQIKAMQDQQQQQLDELNTKIQAQIQKMQADLQSQAQTANNQIQGQLKQMQEQINKNQK